MIRQRLLQEGKKTESLYDNEELAWELFFEDAEPFLRAGMNECVLLLYQAIVGEEKAVLSTPGFVDRAYSDHNVGYPGSTPFSDWGFHDWFRMNLSELDNCARVINTAHDYCSKGMYTDIYAAAMSSQKHRAFLALDFMHDGEKDKEGWEEYDVRGLLKQIFHELFDNFLNLKEGEYTVDLTSGRVMKDGREPDSPAEEEEEL